MSAMPKIFVDGEHGTTGLQIRERLRARRDLDLLSIPAEARRDRNRRADLLNAADIAILCLPDEASREAVTILRESGNNSTRLIDASTAHRTADGWVYGFAELTPGQRAAIAGARFVANPGCYSTGAIALIRPLVDAGLLPPDYPLSINAISGYSGGGKSLIGRMENVDNPEHISANHYLYALNLAHKHLPEIVAHGRLTRVPVFTPSVGRFAQGMLVNIPLHVDLLAAGANAKRLREALLEHYRGGAFVSVADLAPGQERIDAEEMRGTDAMKLYVLSDPSGARLNLVASLDNLGKGAAGAAVQDLDIMLEGG